MPGCLAWLGDPRRGVGEKTTGPTGQKRGPTGGGLCEFGHRVPGPVPRPIQDFCTGWGGQQTDPTRVKVPQQIKSDEAGNFCSSLTPNSQMCKCHFDWSQRPCILSDTLSQNTARYQPITCPVATHSEGRTRDGDPSSPLKPPIRPRPVGQIQWCN